MRWTWNQPHPRCVEPGMDDIERDAVRAEGYDPDDPAVVAALNRVRAELAEWATSRDGNFHNSRCE